NLVRLRFRIIRPPNQVFPEQGSWVDGAALSRRPQMRFTHAGRAARLAVGAAAAVALLAGCSTSSGADGAAADRTDVNYALPANATPNWIVPLGIAGKLATHNSA